MRKFVSFVTLCLISTIICFGQGSAHLKGRSVVGSLPKPNNETSAKGTVVVAIKVDQYGNVAEAIPGAEGTTTTNKDLRTAARAAALKTHFSKSANAPALQTGTITYVFNGSIDEEYISLKDLVEIHESGTYLIRALLKEIVDYSELIFTVEQDDYIVPVKLVKKDLGAENRFRKLDIQKGDTLTIKGKLSTIYVRLDDYKGLNDATIINKKEGVRLLDVPENQSESVPFQLVEQKPSFNGGDANEFSKWVNSRLVYPEKAKENGIQGRVTLQYTIEADGRVTNVRVLRGVEPSLDAEAVRVVSSSPKWKPGKQRDVPVAVTYTFPVIFQLR